MAARSDTIALSRPVPFLLERAYAGGLSGAGQILDLPLRRTTDGALVAPTVAGSAVTVIDPAGVSVVDGAAITVTSSLASVALPASTPAATASLGDNWLVIFNAVVDGVVYTFRHSAILCKYVPRNCITAADLYGGDGIPELRHMVPQAQGDRGDGTGWGPQIDAAYYDFIRRMLSEGRPVWLAREPSGYRDWLLARALQLACDAIPAAEGSTWDGYRKRAYFRMRDAESRLRFAYDDDDIGARRGNGPIVFSPVGRAVW